MVKVSICMACKQWRKGWQDRVNPPYNQHYCTNCWAKYMGYQDVSGKDTVWLRETWKHDNRAVSHSASCARAERHEARKAKNKAVHMHASTWNSAFPDATVSGARSADATSGSSEEMLEDREETIGDDDVGEEVEDNAVGKTIVLLKTFCGMPRGTRARIVKAQATRSGARQRFILGPMCEGQRLGQYKNEGVLSDKLGKLFEFIDKEVEEEVFEAPTWVQRGIDVLWQQGGGNMKYINFHNLVGQREMTGVSKKDVFARPEFEVCGKGNNSIRLAGWLRIQPYG
eukprot:TRINITY_DN64971_c0_g1_i1.p1 TRINITY_DN64971_c0_g1~~TRINITY_DN64971_c0_g1_i1.p1  ORF type:complete len:285 (+),score=40.87 TRINITY_DN64971_c0_g1_i1:34-888(+)